MIYPIKNDHAASNNDKKSSIFDEKSSKIIKNWKKLEGSERFFL